MSGLNRDVDRIGKLSDGHLAVVEVTAELHGDEYHHVGDISVNSKITSLALEVDNRNGDIEVMPNRIKELRKAKGWSQAYLASEMGTTPQQVQRLEAGKRRLTQEWLDKFAKALEVRRAALLDSDEPLFPPRGDLIHASGEHEFGPDEIPVYGYAAASGGDWLNLNNGEEVGRVLRHPQQRGAKRAFGIYVVGTSMEPRYKPGELVYLVDGRLPAAGEDCVVELHNGDGYLKEYRRRSNREVYCWQWDPLPSGQEWKMDLADVKTIHCVVGRG